MTLLGFVLQWFSSVAVLLLASALLAEEEKEQLENATSSVGKRAVELLLRAFERLGIPAGKFRGVLLGRQGSDDEQAGARRDASKGTPTSSQSRARSVALSVRETEKSGRTHVNLQGLSLSFGDVRIVDNKYACYRIGVVPSTGPRWEVWRRMADMIKLRSALGKVYGVDVDLPQLPHSYRRSFDPSHLTRRRRRIQRFLQVVLANPALRDCDAFREFLSPEFEGVNPLARTATLASSETSRNGATSPPLKTPQLSVYSSLTTSTSTSGGRGIGQGSETARDRFDSPPRRRRSHTSVVGSGAATGVTNGTDTTPELPERKRQASAGAAAATSGSERIGGAVDGSNGGSAADERTADSGPGYGFFARETVTSEGGRGSAGGDRSGGAGERGESSSDEEPEHDGGDTFEPRLASGTSWVGEGNGIGAGTPPWSPVATSPRSSGRKSMDYMKNAVMTGTRRIARSVPMSMPNPKTIQKHIPIPKGVPKFSAMYNPYRRSSARRTTSSSDSQSEGVTPLAGSPSDFTDADGGESMMTATAARRGLSIDAGALLSSYLDTAAVPDAATPGAVPNGSPRRKSYRWKRNLKTSQGNNGTSGSYENGRTGDGEATGGSEAMSRRQQENSAMDDWDALLMSGHGAAAAGAGAGSSAEVSVAYLMPGCSDGGTEHTFEVRGESFLSDNGAKVPAGPAVCPLVYAELVTVRRREPSAARAEAPAAPTAPTIAVRGGEAANTSAAGRVDHVAVKGRCAQIIAELGKAGGGQGGVESEESAPLLFVVNFQIPGDPPLSLIAAWALQPEWLSPDCPKAIRRFFGNFYRFLDVPLSSPSARTSPDKSPASCSSLSSDNDGQQRGSPNKAPPSVDVGVLPVVVEAPSDERAAAAADFKDKSGDTGRDGSAALEGRDANGIEKESVTSGIGASGGEGEGTLSSGGTAGLDSSKRGPRAGTYPSGSSDDDSDAEDGCSSNGGTGENKEIGGRYADQDGSTGGSRHRAPKPSARDEASSRNADNGRDGLLPRNDWRNRCLRLVVDVVDGPTVVRKAVPSSDAALGQKTNTRFWRGERYMEVDVDLASALPASLLTVLCRKHSKDLTIDLGLILQGAEGHELPENLLGVVRIEALDLQDTSHCRCLWDSA